MLNILLTSKTDFKISWLMSMLALDCMLNMIFTSDIIWLDVIDMLNLFH